MRDDELLGIAEKTANVLEDANCGMGDVVNVIKLLVITVKEKNAKIKELEAPKTCDGCRFENTIKEFGQCIMWCTRNYCFDKYTPKDNK